MRQTAASRGTSTIPDRLGNAEPAALHFAWFVELWQHADPELLPLVDDARNRLVRLTGEG